MPSWFTDVFEDDARTSLNDYFGETVMMTSGTKTTDSFTAIRKSYEYESVELETGLPVKLHSVDWTLPAASLVIDGATVEPKRGMRIVESGNVYEIMPLPGKPAAELMTGNRWLVHTKKVTA